MLPGMTCLPTSKDITIASGFILPLGISPLNRQNAAPLDPVSTKSGEGQIQHIAVPMIGGMVFSAILALVVIPPSRN